MRFDLGRGFRCHHQETPSAFDHYELLWVLKGETNIKFFATMQSPLGRMGEERGGDWVPFTASSGAVGRRRTAARSTSSPRRR